MRIPSIQLKAAALVPMPRVRQRIAIIEKQGLRRSMRKPKRRSWRTVCIVSLFVPERFDRIWRGRATCRQPGRDEGGDGKQQWRGGKGDWIECAHLVQNPAEYFSGRGGENKAKRDAAKKHHRTFAHD